MVGLIIELDKQYLTILKRWLFFNTHPLADDESSNWRGFHHSRCYKNYGMQVDPPEIQPILV